MTGGAAGKLDRWYAAALVGVALLGLIAWLQYRQYQVMVRNHNLDVFYKSLSCDDLPLGGGTNVAECERAVGTFMLPESGLFTVEHGR